MFNVTLRCLEVFLAVVETGSFTRAAENFNISQPSVSAHILTLEREVVGTVFERRRGSKPVLTDLGRSVLEHARNMLSQADDMRANIVSINNCASQQVVFSCQRSLANYILKEPLTRFALTKTNIKLIVRIGTEEDVIEEVREGIADIGCFLSNEEIRGLNSQTIGLQRLCLVSAPMHPLAKRRNIKPEEIAKYGFVGPPPASLFGRGINILLDSIGIHDPNIVAQATEYQFLRELIAANVGIACSPEQSVQQDVLSGRLCVLQVDSPKLTFAIRLATSTYRPFSESMKELIVYLQENIPACSLTA